MKKLFLVWVMILTLAFSAWADRSSELTDERTKLIQQRDEYTRIIQQIEIRLIEIQGVLKEKAREIKEAKPIESKPEVKPTTE